MAQCSQCGDELGKASDVCPRCEPTPSDPLVGQELLGRYRIVRFLAEGGMGRVYLAEQAVGSISRRVAVKILHKALGHDRYLVHRFAREAETLVRLAHPNTVQLFDFGALSDGTLALIMEYVEGDTLSREIARGPLSLARVERILVQLAGALQEAHANGIVHRDLKPDNVLIADRVGHDDFVKVLDFGIAQVSTNEVAATKLTQKGMIVGTPPYMSPEQFGGAALDARSDIYSLGVIMFEALTGALPFEAKTPWEWASRHLTAEPAPLDLTRTAGLLPRHADAIQRALEKQVEHRHQTVDDFVNAFLGRDDGHRISSKSGPSQVAHGGQPRVVQDSASSAQAITHASTIVFLRRFSGPAIVGGLVGGGILALAAYVMSSHETSDGPARLPPPLAASPAVVSPPALPTVMSSDAGPQTPAVDAARPNGSVGPAGKAVRGTGLQARTKQRPPTATAPDSSPPRPAPSPPPAPTAEARIGAQLPAQSGARPSDDVPPDLALRIGKIRETASRPEVAVSLFQAAFARYGSHPALSPLRVELTRMGEPRIRQLLAGGRCAQAQALQRALASIGAASSESTFGGACPTP